MRIKKKKMTFKFYYLIYIFMFHIRNLKDNRFAKYAISKINFSHIPHGISVFMFEIFCQCKTF